MSSKQFKGTVVVSSDTNSQNIILSGNQAELRVGIASEPGEIQVRGSENHRAVLNPESLKLQSPNETGNIYQNDVEITNNKVVIRNNNEEKIKLDSSGGIECDFVRLNEGGAVLHNDPLRGGSLSASAIIVSELWGPYNKRAMRVYEDPASHRKKVELKANDIIIETVSTSYNVLDEIEKLKEEISALKAQLP